MDEEFTLEKMKLTERMHALELQLTRFMSHLESEQQIRLSMHSENLQALEKIRISIERIEKVIYGNEKEGLVSKIAILMEDQDTKKIEKLAAFTAFFGLCAKVLYDFFKK